MNTYSVEMPDGSVIDDVPEGTTDDQLMAEWNRLKSFDPGSQGLPQGSLLTPEEQLKSEFGRAFGLPPEQIDFGNSAGQGMRLALGAASDNPAEREAFIRQQYPGANVQQRGDYFAVQQQPGTPPVFMNPPGMDWGDVTEFFGNVGPSVAGGLAGTAVGVASSPSGPAAPLVGGAVGVAVSEGAKELAQSFVGSQRETLPEFGTRAAIGAGLEFLPGLAIPAKAAWRKLAGSGGDALASTLAGGKAKDLEGLTQTLKNSGELTLPDLMLFQKSDNPLLRKVATQSRQFSDVAKQRYLDQLNQLGEVARMAAPGAGQPLSADEIVQEGLAAYNRRVKGRVAPEMDTQVAGDNLIGGTRGGLDSRKAEMSQAYKNLDEVYKAEEPVFDLTKTVELAQPRKVNLTDVEGNPVNVAAAPTSELAGIMQDIGKLAPVQENFEGVKEVRSRLGSLLEIPPVKLAESGIDIGQVKQLYGQLSEDIMTDTGSRAFEDAARAAGSKAKRYHDTFDHPPVREVLTAEGGKIPVQLWDSMASNPQKWEGELLTLLSEGDVAGTSLGRLRNNVSNMVSAAPDPVGTLARWEAKNPQGLKRLFPRENELKTLRKNVAIADRLGKSISNDAAQATDVKVGFAMDAIREHGKRMPKGQTDKTAHMQSLVQSAGPESGPALRNAVFTDTIRNSLGTHKGTGAFTLQPGKLEDAIRELKETGAWKGILSERDRRAMMAMKDFSKRVYESGDAGTGLAIASQVGQVRQGDLSALASIRMSQALANVITRTELPLGSLFKKVPGSAGPLTAPVVDVLYRSLAQGPVADAVLSGLQDPAQPEQQQQ